MTGGTVDQYLYKLTPIRPEMLSEGCTQQEEEAVAKHFAFLSDLKDQGVVKFAGRTTNTDASSFGVVVFEAKDEEAARDIMARDPAVSGNVLAAKLFPFRIALLSDPVA
jgi:uncharacterized protein YciI